MERRPAGAHGHDSLARRCLVGTNKDGSAYLEVSNLEKTLRTRWTVRVTLHPGRAYLDEQIRIVNPVDAVNPYYFWNCTAFPAKKGTRFMYPMTIGTDHYGREFFNWPINDGKDLSWLKNYERSASIFAVDCMFDFFGAYDVDDDRGVVQVANHYELSGKKAWTWGTWDFGLVSQENLTDDDGPVHRGPERTATDAVRLWHAPAQTAGRVARVVVSRSTGWARASSSPPKTSRSRQPARRANCG